MASNLFGNFAMSHGPNEISQVKEQNTILSQYMVHYLLNEQGIRMNGYVTGNGHSMSFRNRIARHRGLQDAMKTLEKSCKEMKSKYQSDIESEVATLDINDSQLYASFRDSCVGLMDDDIRWGRIAVLFFFTSVLAKRLHNEGQAVKIDSLIGWLRCFLDEALAKWIVEHGGWGAIKGAVNVEGAPKPEGKPNWLAYLGLGVAAAGLVGALTIR